MSLESYKKSEGASYMIHKVINSDLLFAKEAIQHAKASIIEVLNAERIL